MYQKSVFKEVKFKKKYLNHLNLSITSLNVQNLFSKYFAKIKAYIMSGMPSADDIIKSTALPSCQQHNFAENELYSQLRNESSNTGTAL